jgi:hypothetical protein
MEELMTTAAMVDVIARARDAGWEGGDAPAPVFDQIVTTYRSAESPGVLLVAPLADDDTLAATLSAHAAAAGEWLRQRSPCHLCHAPAGAPCALGCVADPATYG